MAEFPALPLWTDAYLADTTHLDMRESGCYLQLLMAAWRRPNCDLPDDDAFFARLCRMDGRTWKRSVRPVLEQFFAIENGTWRQKRLQKERKYVADLSEKQLSNAMVRWNKNKNLTDATAIPTRCQTDAPTPTPISKKEKDSLTGVQKESATASPSLPSKPAAVRGSRLPEGWTLSADDRDYARSRGLSFEATEAMALDFEQYWRAKAGKDAVKCDWRATWQRWVRNSENHKRSSGASNLKEERLYEERKIKEWIVEQAFKSGVAPLAVESDGGDTDPIQRNYGDPKGEVVPIRGSPFKLRGFS